MVTFILWIWQRAVAISVTGGSACGKAGPSTEGRGPHPCDAVLPYGKGRQVRRSGTASSVQARAQADQEVRRDSAEEAPRRKHFPLAVGGPGALAVGCEKPRGKCITRKISPSCRLRQLQSDPQGRFLFI